MIKLNLRYHASEISKSVDTSQGKLRIQGVMYFLIIFFTDWSIFNSILIFKKRSFWIILCFIFNRKVVFVPYTLLILLHLGENLMMV